MAPSLESLATAPLAPPPEPQSQHPRPEAPSVTPSRSPSLEATSDRSLAEAAAPPPVTTLFPLGPGMSSTSSGASGGASPVGLGSGGSVYAAPLPPSSATGPQLQSARESSSAPVLPLLPLLPVPQPPSTSGPQLPVSSPSCPLFDEAPAPAYPLLRYDAVDHLRHMGAALWEQRLFPDVSIVCEGVEVTQAHRCVLAAASPVLAAMLQGEMTEAREQKIHFRDTEPSTVEAMLQFIYTGSLPKDVDSRAILHLAHMYSIQGLAAHCCHSLVTTLTSENVAESIRVLRQCSDDEVTHRAYKAVCDQVFSDRSLFDAIVKSI